VQCILFLFFVFIFFVLFDEFFIYTFCFVFFFWDLVLD